MCCNSYPASPDWSPLPKSLESCTTPYQLLVTHFHAQHLTSWAYLHLALCMQALSTHHLICPESFFRQRGKVGLTANHASHVLRNEVSGCKSAAFGTCESRSETGPGPAGWTGKHQWGWHPGHHWLPHPVGSACCRHALPLAISAITTLPHFCVACHFLRITAPHKANSKTCHMPLDNKPVHANMHMKVGTQTAVRVCCLSRINMMSEG